jgi:hypothetical protein
LLIRRFIHDGWMGSMSGITPPKQANVRLAIAASR